MMGTHSQKRPLVSVGVPVYNGELYLAEALASAVAQDHDNVEIVICDNASSDGTEEICRRFARQDSRIRYLRNTENVGGSKNFSRVLAEAKGEYFTWLAHDDVLSDPTYLRTTCEVLQSNPDVVLCGCSMDVLENLGPGTSTPALLEHLYPDQNWHHARKHFFRCPFDSLIYFAIYGVFRRDVLLTVPIAERWYKGKRVVLDLENPILATVATRGRIVALPERLRSYRYHDKSNWHVDLERLSAWDRGVLNFEMKAKILGIALGAPLPLSQRLGLARVALGNFFRHVFGVPTDYKAQVKNLKNHVHRLSVDCDVRLKTIDALKATCAEHEHTIDDLKVQYDAQLALIGRLAQQSRTHSTNGQADVVGQGDAPRHRDVEHAPPQATSDLAALAERLCLMEKQLADANQERETLQQKLSEALREGALRNLPRRLYKKVAGRLRGLSALEASQAK